MTERITYILKSVIINIPTQESSTKEIHVTEKNHVKKGKQTKQIKHNTEKKVIITKIRSER